MNYTRTSAHFLLDKAKGQKAEKTFIELIAAMGGTAQSLGTIPGVADKPHAFLDAQHLRNWILFFCFTGCSFTRQMSQKVSLH